MNVYLLSVVYAFAQYVLFWHENVAGSGCNVLSRMHLVQKCIMASHMCPSITVGCAEMICDYTVM